MTRPNDIKKTFQAFCDGRGVDPVKLREADAIALFKAFYDACSFDGRASGTKEDTLLFQTENPSHKASWSANITRQLYSHGNGIQLGLTWTYEGDSFLADISVRSEGGTAQAWADEATQAAAGLAAGNKTPASVEISLNMF